MTPTHPLIPEREHPILREELELSKHDRALYEKLHASCDDIIWARSCAEMILKKGWHTPYFTRRGSVQIQQIAFTTTMIVTYARPFSPGRGNLNFPDRLLNYSLEERALHDRLLELRKKQYAHADASTINVQPRKGDVAWIDRSLRQVHFSLEEVTLFLTMTRGLIDRIWQRMEEIRLAARPGLTVALKA